MSQLRSVTDQGGKLLVQAPVRSIPQTRTGGTLKRRSNQSGFTLTSAITSTMAQKRNRLDLSLENSHSSSPMDFIISSFRDNGCDARIQVSTMSNLFHSPTEDEIAAYSQDVLQAVRDRNIDQLRSYVKEGRSLQCCNRFGESLMHMACRRGFTDVVMVLVMEAKCSLYVRDDYGRTAMHDAAWSPEPNFEMMDFLMDQAPELLLMSDVRGHTPFSYVRKEHWPKWMDFLQLRSEKLRSTTSHDDKEIIVIG